MSFYELLSAPAVQKAMAQARATQVGKNLAVQPKPALESLSRDALQRSRLSYEMAHGARQLKLQGRETDQRIAKSKLDMRESKMVQDAAAFQQKLMPFELVKSTIGAGRNVLQVSQNNTREAQREARLATVEAREDAAAADRKARLDEYLEAHGILRRVYRPKTTQPASPPSSNSYRPALAGFGE